MTDKPSNVTVTVGKLSDPPSQRWFCPTCGKPAEMLMTRSRLIICAHCHWIFEVRLHRATTPESVVHDTQEDPCTLCGLKR